MFFLREVNKSVFSISEQCSQSSSMHTLVPVVRNEPGPSGSSVWFWGIAGPTLPAQCIPPEETGCTTGHKNQCSLFCSMTAPHSLHHPYLMRQGVPSVVDHSAIGSVAWLVLKPIQHLRQETPGTLDHRSKQGHSHGVNTGWTNFAMFPPHQHCPPSPAPEKF